MYVVSVVFEMSIHPFPRGFSYSCDSTLTSFAWFPFQKSFRGDPRERANSHFLPSLTLTNVHRLLHIQPLVSDQYWRGPNGRAAGRMAACVIRMRERKKERWGMEKVQNAFGWSCPRIAITFLPNIHFVVLLLPIWANVDAHLISFKWIERRFGENKNLSSSFCSFRVEWKGEEQEQDR